MAAVTGELAETLASVAAELNAVACERLPGLPGQIGGLARLLDRLVQEGAEAADRVWMKVSSE